LFGGSLLIAATAIGVGMLALPIATGPGGFLPSILIYVACWAFMLCTGLLLLEVCTWMPSDSNLITMSSRILGRPGKIVCWLTYLFLFETVMIAHVVGGGSISAEILPGSLGTTPPMLLYVLIFAPVVYLGTRTVDRLNLFMFSGVIASYFLFLFISSSHVKWSLLSYMKWGKIWVAIPILFTSFTYQVIIPTLVTYMERDFKKVRKAIIIGSSIPLIVYIIWQVLILGIIPVEGPNGLIAASRTGQNAVAPLKHFVGSQIVVAIGKAFGFFAMTASYIALALAFLGFLADGLGFKKVGIRKFALVLLVFVPPFFVSMVNPGIFLKALSYAGGISCAILFGIYPPLIVWIGRYKKGHTTGQQIPGGRVFLSSLIVLTVTELLIEIAPKLFK
jgi:tyrosine-specific transport protein